MLLIALSHPGVCLFIYLWKFSVPLITSYHPGPILFVYFYLFTADLSNRPVLFKIYTEKLARIEPADAGRNTDVCRWSLIYWILSNREEMVRDMYHSRPIQNYQFKINYIWSNIRFIKVLVTFRLPWLRHSNEIACNAGGTFTNPALNRQSTEMSDQLDYTRLTSHLSQSL